MSATPMRSGSPCAKPRFDTATACPRDGYMAWQSPKGSSLPKCFASNARVYQPVDGPIPIAPAARGSAQSGFCEIASAGGVSGWLRTRDLSETSRFRRRARPPRRRSRR